MNRTPSEQEEWERMCYGCTQAELRTGIENSLPVKLPGAGGYGMIAMSMLSDVQEQLDRRLNEEARQTINCAKWVIRTYLMKGD